MYNARTRVRALLFCLLNGGPRIKTIKIKIPELRQVYRKTSDATWNIPHRSRPINEELFAQLRFSLYRYEMGGDDDVVILIIQRLGHGESQKP